MHPPTRAERPPLTLPTSICLNLAPSTHRPTKRRTMSLTGVFQPIPRRSWFGRAMPSTPHPGLSWGSQRGQTSTASGDDLISFFVSSWMLVTFRIKMEADRLLTNRFESFLLLPGEKKVTIEVDTRKSQIVTFLEDSPPTNACLLTNLVSQASPTAPSSISRRRTTPLVT